MKRFLQATKDTYVTNRLIRNSFRATDANVGHAGTLDLFKLAGESTITYVTASVSGSTLLHGNGPFVSGTEEPIELSRVLIKFDLDPLRQLTGSILDLDASSFKCTLRLFDVMGGQTLPSNFSLVLYPLSRSFDEGPGLDVISFEDIGASNFITASDSGGLVVTWSQSTVESDIAAGLGPTVFIGGASHLGYVGEPLVDAVTGSAGLGDVFVVQQFIEGDEDLSMDVTTIVSATLVGLLPDHGFRISFSGTQETDDRTRFVKRFATRHSTNTRIRPKIEVGFDDSTKDNHKSFFFDCSGSLFLNSFRRGSPADIVSGSGLTHITGVNCMLLTLVSGSGSTYFSTTVTASQHSAGNNFVTGVYSASFAISSFAAILRDEIVSAHSATFTELWGSLDGTVGYHTGTLVVRSLERTSFSDSPGELKLNITNMRNSYKSSERVRFRIFAQDDGFSFKASKLPIEAVSEMLDDMHHRMRDHGSNELMYDFDTTNGSTRVSMDSDGMYFDAYMSDLDVGRVYTIELLVNERGVQRVFEHVGGSFRIDA